jgi:hypothetical protein
MKWGIGLGHWTGSTVSLVRAFFVWVQELNFRGGKTDVKTLILEEIESTKWLSPGTKRRAIIKAKDKADAARWNLETAIFLFAVLILIIILNAYTLAGLGLITFTAVFGLAMVWLVGWRRGRKLRTRYYYEELAQHTDDWKDYYKILRLSPSAKHETINESYQRLIKLHKNLLYGKAPSIPTYSLSLRDVNEAHEVLSDPITRINYDRLFWLKYNVGLHCRHRYPNGCKN